MRGKVIARHSRKGEKELGGDWGVCKSRCHIAKKGELGNETRKTKEAIPKGVDMSSVHL